MQLVKADTPVTAQAVPFKDKTVRGKLWVILPWVVFGAACVLLVVGLCVHYAVGLDSDMASELVLAKMLAEGKGFIITNQWYYSTEIRFLNTQLIFAPLFWLFKSWAVVRIVGTIILHGIMVLAFYFLLASLQRKDLFPWLATFLLLSFSADWQHFVNYGAFYLPHLAIAFVVLGLTFYALKATKSKCRNWLIAGAAILSGLAGVGGFRQVVVTSIPLFMAAVIFWLINHRTERKSVANKFFVASSIALGGALLGLIVNIILGQWFYFYRFLGVAWRQPSLDCLWTLVNSLLTAFGWRETRLMGWGTFGNLLSLVLVGLFIVSSVSILKRQQSYAATTVGLTLFTVTAWLIMAGVYTFTSMENLDRVNLLVFVFALPVCGLWLTENRQWRISWAKISLTLKGVIGGLLYAIACLVVLCNFCGWYFTPMDEQQQALLSVTGELVAAGYYQGYGSMWQANVMTELSNGAIEMWCWGQPDWANGYADRYDTLDHVWPWLQAVDHSDHYPTGKVFMIFTPDEVLRYAIPQRLAQVGGHTFCQNQYYTVFVYDSVDELAAVLS